MCGSQPKIEDGSDQPREREEQGAKAGKKPEIDPAIIEELMKGYQQPEDMTGRGGVLEQLTKRVCERILSGEMTHYLGYEKGQAPALEEGQKRQNHRNGSSKKILTSEDGKLEIEVPGIGPGSLSHSLSVKVSAALEASIQRSSLCMLRG